MDAATLKLAKNYTNEQVVQKATNSPVEEISFDGGIYSVGNNVVNGQVSDVVLKGNSIFNHADNGVGYANWTVAGTGTTKGANGIHLLDDEHKEYAIIPVKFKPSTTYTVVLNVSAKTSTSIAIMGKASDTNSPLDNTKAIDIASTGILKIPITTSETLSSNPHLRFYCNLNETTDANKYIDFELYSILEGDYTADTSVNKPFKFGVNSTFPAGGMIRSVGKNLFDKNAKPIANKYIGSTDGSLVDSVTGYNVFTIPIEPNKQYKRSFGFNKSYRFLDYSSQLLTFGESNISVPITAPSNAKYLQVSIKEVNYDVGQIESGTVSTAYEPYKESIVNVNLPEPLRSLPNGVKDEVSIGADGTTETRRNKKYVLQASDISNISTTPTNVDHVLIKKPTDFLYYNSVSGASDKAFRLGDYKLFVSGSGFDNANNINSVSSSASIFYFYLIIEKGTYADLAAAQAALAGTTLTYQLAEPIITKLPAQPPLQVFENGTVYVEPMGDPAESTVPSVEMTIPTGTSNKFGVASHDYDRAAADWTLTNSESKCFMLAVSNAGGAANIIAPDRPGTMYAISNASGYAITIKKSGGTGVAVTNAKTVLVIHNGTDYTALTAEL